MTYLEDALTYLDMGWCVYPAHGVDLLTGACTCGRLDCPCPGKHPVGQWIDFQRRFPTTQEVKTWFSTLQCNVGMVTGSISGIVVVDVDGREGISTVRELGLKPTLVSRTGSGGYHYFYSSKGSSTYPTRTRALPGIDIRGEGGYVVLPPSLHRSGNYYRWERTANLSPFDPTPFERHLDRNLLNHNGNTSTVWVEDLIGGVSEGSRNISAAKLAGRYYRLGLTPSEVWTLMMAWNDRNDPPLPVNELRLTVSYIGKKHEEVAVPVQIRTLQDIQKILEKARQS